MPQTNLKSDNFCGYNNSAATMYWVLDPVQNTVQYNIGETGVPTGVGLNTPGEVIQVDSFLKDIGNYLTACNPPAPTLPSKLGYASDASITNSGNSLPVQGGNVNLEMQNSPQFNVINSNIFNNEKVLENFTETKKENFANNYFQNQQILENNMNENNMNENNNDKEKYTNLARENYISADGSLQTFNNIQPFTSRVVNANTFLLPDAGQRVKRSANDTSSVNWQGGFGGNSGNLLTDPQNLTYVIERMALERGGLDQNSLIKQSYNLYTKDHPLGPQNLKGNYQTPTALKIKHPYPTSAPFGLDFNQKSIKFDAIDVVSQGKSSPNYGQNNELPFNHSAPIINGGCNKTSLVKINKMCSNSSNDLTGVNSFNWNTEISPIGV